MVSTKQNKDKKINNLYQYEDLDMFKILELRLQQENTPNVFALPPIGTQEGENHLTRELNDEKTRNILVPNRIILLPYNLGNYHWVAVIIRIENSVPVTFNYIDSMISSINQGNNQESQNILQILNLVYGTNILDINRLGLQQEDSTSCGPVIIENLINAARDSQVQGRINAHDIRYQHVDLMETYAPEDRFYMRQLLNVPSFKQYKKEASRSTHISNSGMKSELEQIAANYENANTIPLGFTKDQLLDYLVQAIEHLNQSQNSVDFLVAISALSKTLVSNYSKFTEANSGIPWDALADLKRNISPQYEPSHGLGGHTVVTSKRAFTNSDFRQKMLVAIKEELNGLKDNFEMLRDFQYVVIKFPIANKIKAIADYFGEEVQLILLAQALKKIAKPDLVSPEGRIFYLRQLAIIGEVFANLPKSRLTSVDQTLKKIRNALDHFETEFVTSNPGDKELKSLVVWLKNFIETGNSSDITVSINFIFNHEAIGKSVQTVLSTTSTAIDMNSISKQAENYTQEFLKDITKDSGIYEQIEFLKYYLTDPTLRTGDIDERFSGIEDRLLKINKKSIPDLKTKEIRKVEISYIGALNTLGKKGGAEKLDSINEIIYFLFIFKGHYSDLKSKEPGSLFDIDKKFIEQYESVKTSCLAKINQVSSSKVLSIREKMIYLTNFLKFSLISGNAIEDLQNQISELEKLNIPGTKASKDNSLGNEQIQKALPLISGVLELTPQVLDFDEKTRGLISPISKKHTNALRLLNQYENGMTLLRDIGGEKFILTSDSQGDVKINDRTVRDFTKFFNSLSQGQQERIESWCKQVNNEEMQYRIFLQQQEILSYGMHVQNPGTAPQNYSPPTRNVKYIRMQDSDNEKISKLVTHYHVNRERYQIIIGSYARALLDNDIFMNCVSDGLIETLHHLRAARGYLGHNTEPNPGKGIIDMETHSSTIATSLVQRLVSIIPELLSLQLIFQDSEVITTQTSLIKDFVKPASLFNDETKSLLKSLSDKLQEKKSFEIDSGLDEWLSGDQIATASQQFGLSGINFASSIDAYLTDGVHGAIEPMILQHTRAQNIPLASAINLSPNINAQSGKGNHWIFYFAIYDSNGAVHGVLLNPMGTNLYNSAMESVRSRIRSTYGENSNININIHNLGVQSDGHNCGVWVLWFLQYINESIKNGTVIDQSFITDISGNLKIAAQKQNVGNLRTVYLAVASVDISTDESANTPKEATDIDASKSPGKQLILSHQESYGAAEHYVTYHGSGIDRLLPLRIKDSGVSDIAILKTAFLSEATISYLLDAVLTKIQAGFNKVVLPLNIDGKHWVGLIVEASNNHLDIKYLDSENREMPLNAQEVLSVLCAQKGYQVALKSVMVEEQKYSNCGPELIENFLMLLTGNRATQAAAVPLHSLLYENSVLDPDSSALQIAENSRMIEQLSNQNIPLYRMSTLEPKISTVITYYESKPQKYNAAAGNAGFINLLQKSLEYGNSKLDSCFKHASSFFKSNSYVELQALANKYEVNIKVIDAQSARNAYKKIAVKTHSDKIEGNTEDFKLAKELSEQRHIEVSINYNQIMSTLDKGYTVVRTVRTFTDAIKLYNEPEQVNIVSTLTNLGYLVESLAGKSIGMKYFSGVAVGYQIYQGDFNEALTSTATMAAYALPCLLMTTAPALAVTLKIGFIAYDTYYATTELYDVLPAIDLAGETIVFHKFIDN